MKFYRRFLISIMNYSSNLVLDVDLAAAEARKLGLEYPKPSSRGRFNTLNNMGYMAPEPTPWGREFIQISTQPNTKVLEIGCAYGQVCLESLKWGAKYYVANDIDEKHLQILASKIVEEMPDKKNCAILLKGPFPAQDVVDYMSKNRYNAILAERVLRFLTAEEVKRAFEVFQSLLKPGGFLFLEVATPYNGVTKSEFQRQFEHSVDNFLSHTKFDDENYELPGFIENRRNIIDVEKLPKDEMNKIAMTNGHFFLFDKQTLEFMLKKHGFHVEKCEYFARDDEWKFDDREGLYAIAKK